MLYRWQAQVFGEALAPKIVGGLVAALTQQKARERLRRFWRKTYGETLVQIEFFPADAADREKMEAHRAAEMARRRHERENASLEARAGTTNNGGSGDE